MLSQGVYHSSYDSFDWVNEYGGKQGEVGSAFQYMTAAARVWGVLAMRLSGDNFMPFDHFATTKALFNYYAQVSIIFINRIHCKERNRI